MPLSIQGQTVNSVVNNAYQYVSSVVSSSSRYVDCDRENELVITFNIRKFNINTGKVEAIDFFGNDIPDMIESGVLLPIGGSIGGTIWASTSPNYMWESFARLREYTFEPLEGGSVNVTCRFSTLYVPEPVVNPVSNVTELLLPASLEMTSTNRSMPMFWTGDNLTPPSATLESVLIINGSTLSSTTGVLGSPIDVPQMRIRMRIVQDCNNDNSTIVDKITDLKTYIGKRNSEPFLNFAEGEIYCEGMSLQPLENEFYEVVFDFVYDFYFEHSQYPTLEGDGTPVIDEDPLIAGRYRIKEVYWRRPYRESIDFNAIFAANTVLQQYIEQGWWTGVP